MTQFPIYNSRFVEKFLAIVDTGFLESLPYACIYKDRENYFFLLLLLSVVREKSNS